MSNDFDTQHCYVEKDKKMEKYTVANFQQLNATSHVIPVDGKGNKLTFCAGPHINPYFRRKHNEPMADSAVEAEEYDEDEDEDNEDEDDSTEQSIEDTVIVPPLAFKNDVTRLVSLLDSWSIRPGRKKPLCISTKDQEALFLEERDGTLVSWTETLTKSPLCSYRVVDLKELKRRLGAAGTGNNRSTLLDALHRTKKVPPPIQLDADQQEAVALSGNAAKLIVYGPPGAGKTLVLAKIGLAHLQKDSDARILYLMFNVNAEKTMSERLRLLGCPKKQLFTGTGRAKCKDLTRSGCFVMTFDKYLAQRLSERRDTYAVESSSIGQSSYDTWYKRGLGAVAGNWEQWSRVVVDEMQDVKRKHVDLLEQLAEAPYVVVAGDPRQELYEHTGYMTQYWRESEALGFRRIVLRYNHRSRPEIVTAMNDFSRAHFGDLHVDQIPCRAEGGCVTAMAHSDLNSLAQDVAKQVLRTEGGGCVIAPVSVRKYHGTQQLVVATRQHVSDLSGGAVYGRVLWQEQGELVRDPGIICIGTSFAFKGAEEDTVVLIQGDVPYEKLNLTVDQAIRCIFVAISRARDRLHVPLQGALRQDGLLACLKDHLKVQIFKQNIPRKLEHPKIVRVYDELAEPLSFRVNCEPLPRVPPIQASSVKAADYLGIVVEGHVALAFGLDAPTSYEVKVIGATELEGLSLIEDRKRGIIGVKKNLSKLVKHILSKPLKCPEKRFAKLKWTILAQREWTLGDDDTDPKILAKGSAAFAKVYGPGQVRAKALYVPIIAHRSTVKLGHVSGITDLETSTDVIEVKHHKPGSSPDAGLRQLAIYAAYAGKGGILYRSREGLVDRITVPDEDWVHRLARSALGLRQACYRRSQIRSRGSVATDLTPVDRVAVAVDIETVPYSNGTVLEIGAVAFRLDTSRPVDTYHDLARGLGIFDDGSAVSCPKMDLGYYGFDKTTTNFTRVHQDQSRIRADFKTWLDRFPQDTVLIEYHGRDIKTLGLDDRSCLCAWRLFRNWLKSQGQGRMNKTSLEDVIEQLFGSADLFVPHRAFEDAVATAMIVAILST